MTALVVLSVGPVARTLAILLAAAIVLLVVALAINLFVPIFSEPDRDDRAEEES